MVDVDMSASKLTGTWKNLNRQIESVTSKSALIEVERTVDIMPNGPEKTFLKQQIQKKKAELNSPYEPLENYNSRQIEEQNLYDYELQLQQDIANQMILDDLLINLDDGFMGL